MASDQKVRVAIVGLGFGAEFIPIYQNHPERRDVRHLPARPKASSTRSATGSAIKTRYTDYDELLNDPNVDAVHINSPIPDHAPQSDRGAEGRQARRLHRADGHDDRGVPADRRGAARSGQGLHDDGDGRLQPRVPVRQGAVRQGRARAGSSSSAAATSRTWTAGRTTGRACRRCSTPRTASARAWRSSASTPSTSSATARAGSARS